MTKKKNGTPEPSQTGKLPCPECERMERTIAKLTRTGKGAPPKQLHFDEKWVAARLGVSVKTLQAWRLQGKGPKSSKLGGTMVRYRLRDIYAFEKRSRRNSTSDEGSGDHGPTEGR